MLFQDFLKKNKIRFTETETITVNQDLKLAGFDGSLPDNLTVNGTVVFRGCPEMIPAGMKVSGSLDIEGRVTIDHIPPGVEIGGSLYISKTGIEYLPEDLRVGKALYATGHTLKTMPKNIHQIIGGDVDISFSMNKNWEFPEDLVLNKNLYMSGTTTSGVQKLTVKGFFDFRMVKGGLPPFLSCGSLDLRTCEINLPETVMASRIYSDGSAIIPESMKHLIV